MDGSDLEGDVAVQFRPVDGHIDPRHGPDQREQDLRLALVHVPVQVRAHRHTPAVFVGIGQMEAVGFNFVPRQGRQGIADVRGHEEVVGNAPQEAGLQPDRPVREGQLPPGEEPPFFQEAFRVVDEQINVGDKRLVRQDGPGGSAAFRIQDQYGVGILLFPVPIITSYHQA